MHWIKAHKIAVAALAVIVLILIWRKGKASTSTAGHATPDEAMSWGWAVFPYGDAGWTEKGPNGEIVNHDTGGAGISWVSFN